jgi:diguanylate cyclase
MGWLFAAVTTDFGFGLLSGLALLGSGMLCAGIGLWIGRHWGKYNAHDLEARHLAALVRDLFRWTDGFASDLSEYREEVDRLGARFRAASQDSDNREAASVLPLLSQVVAANENISSRMAKAETALQQQAQEIAGYMSEARTDALTGLPNRRAFDDELGRRFSEWRKSKRPLSVIFVDIDHFKKFNDQHGHLVGDAVLAQVARTLREAMHESDLVVRLGGEEFAAILPNCQAVDAGRAAERARKAIELAPFYYEKKRLRVTVSCGAAQATDHEVVSSLVKRADEAMYASKDAGRNRTHLHNGQTCVCIAPTTGRTNSHVPTPATQPSKLTNNPEFRRVCQNLRQKLKEISDCELKEHAECRLRIAE